MSRPDRQAALAALDPAPFGCNSHLARDATIAALADVGVTWQRFDADWDQLEPQPGVFAWQELDRCLATAARLGVSVYVTAAYTPAWASGVTGRRTAAPREGQDFVRFVRTLLRRYPGRIHAMGVWNEPNLQEFYSGTRAFYFDSLLAPGLQAIREEAPQVVTCGPDLSSSRGVKDWLGAALEAAGSLLDVVSHHQYDGGDTPGGRAKAIDDLHAFLGGRGFGDRPLWITETGWKRGSQVTEQQQAVHLRGILREMERRSTWWTKTFWYDSHGAGWGLFGADDTPDAGRPLLAFGAYRDTIQELQPLPLDELSLRTVVEHAYQGILARAADAVGLAAYVGALRQGRPTAAVCAELFGSDEWRRTRGSLPDEAVAAQLFAGILRRPADPGGLAETAVALRAGRGPQRAAAMLESREFRDTFLRRTRRD